MKVSTDLMFTNDRMTLYTIPGKEVSTEVGPRLQTVLIPSIKKKKVSPQAHELGDTT